MERGMVGNLLLQGWDPLQEQSRCCPMQSRIKNVVRVSLHSSGWRRHQNADFHFVEEAHSVSELEQKRLGVRAWPHRGSQHTREAEKAPRCRFVREELEKARRFRTSNSQRVDPPCGGICSSLWVCHGWMAAKSEQESLRERKSERGCGRERASDRQM
ncbi:hypothetical protein KSP39_PZI009464 [Platanthera zijinensis]|uniref:Uncharacterized protein n=1 Tax=Platanthera zijinensis TaxID=2320716 RepID=A0AAP0BKI2_9ASPA